MFLKKELTEYNRYQAFAIHMAISLVIFLILLVFITQYWYPGILFDTGNGWKAIGMIIGIDLILGPLLTLIVFNPMKSSLKFDLSVIALVQTAALIYGIWTIHQTHPIALAFINTSFSTIYKHNEFDGDIEDRIAQLNTRIFYYEFSDEQAGLVSDQLKPYTKFSAQILTLRSPYIEKDKHNNSDLSYWVRLDPLLTKGRYLEVDKNTGNILSFTKNKP